MDEDYIFRNQFFSKNNLFKSFIIHRLSTIHVCMYCRFVLDYITSPRIAQDDEPL